MRCVMPKLSASYNRIESKSNNNNLEFNVKDRAEQQVAGYIKIDYLIAITQLHFPLIHLFKLFKRASISAITGSALTSSACINKIHKNRFILCSHHNNIKSLTSGRRRSF
jgi:hypothetical protein